MSNSIWTTLKKFCINLPICPSVRPSVNPVMREFKLQRFWVTHLNRTWTFALLRRDFKQMFAQIVSIRVKTLSNTNLVASRQFKMENGSLPVDVCGSKTSLLKLPIISFRPRLSQKKCMQFYLAFEVKLYAGDWYNCTGKILRFFKIHLKQFASVKGDWCHVLKSVRGMKSVLTVNYIIILYWWLYWLPLCPGRIKYLLKLSLRRRQMPEKLSQL